MTQYDRLAKLLTRKRGTTAMEICEAVGTVAPHKRMSEMRERGWDIRKEPVPGRTFHRYFGTAPQGV